MNPKYLLLIILFVQLSFGQKQENKIENLDSVIVNTERMALPFSKNSRTITLITTSQIKKATALSVAELLQNFAGVDIRRRGLDGMQADLYLRGGSFDQTLLLIDGIPVEDAQTGHHLLNSLPSLEVIKRIEIIKGPAARIYGQNAFTGAINIVTKKAEDNSVVLKASTGSFNHVNLGLQVNQSNKKLSQIFQIKRNTSAGYRFNTDFKNNNAMYKANFKIKKWPVNLLATYTDKKFGANGFYASPNYKDQYEETQTSLIGLGTTYKKENYKLNTKLYWKRNQDMYEFLRYNPTYFRNFHITNKVGASFNSTVTSDKGITGFGLDMAKNYIVSNNLGTHNRYVVTGFLEHRFNLNNGTLNITPGVALNYYSDFNFHAFPGIDLGFQLSENTRIYANMGYTYRVPTYTDLFYNSPTTLGNAHLKPEEAVGEEFGFKFKKTSFSFDLALYNRQSKNLIDYVKNDSTDKWNAQNVRRVNSYGIELNSAYNFNIKNYSQKFSVGYNYLKDNIKSIDIPFSRYVLNSMKHQIVAALNTQFLKHLSQSINYKFVQRPEGTNYTVFDAKINLKVKNVNAFISGNNIFNAVYTETNLVPMPKSNYVIGLNYIFE